MSDRESLERIEQALAEFATLYYAHRQTLPPLAASRLDEARAVLRALLAEPQGTCRACGRPRDLAYLLMCDDCVRRGVPIPAVSGPGVSRAEPHDAVELIRWAENALGIDTLGGLPTWDEVRMVGRRLREYIERDAGRDSGVSRADAPGGDACPEGWTTEEDVRVDTLNEARRDELRRIAGEVARGDQYPHLPFGGDGQDIPVARGDQCPGEGEESRT